MLEANRENALVYGFYNAETLVRSIYNYYNENGKNIFVKEFNIEELTMDIERAKKQISYNYKIIGNTLIDEGRITQRQLKNCILNMENGESIDDICKDYINCSTDLKLYLETYQKTNNSRKSTEVPKEVIQKTRMGLLTNIREKINLIVQNKNHNKGGIVNGIK